MTSVIAVVTKNYSFMAADTLAYSSTHSTEGQSKIIKKNDKLLIGVSGSYAIMNCMQYYLNPPKRRKDYTSKQYVQTQLYFAIRNALIKMSLLGSNGEGAQTIKGEILIIYDGLLYVIQNDFSLLETTDQVYAIGSGSEYTLAAYHTLDIHKSSLLTIDKMKEALRITSKFCPSVNDKSSVLYLRHEGSTNQDHIMDKIISQKIFSK